MSSTKVERRCIEKGCAANKQQGDLCGYHATKKEWGETWARIAYPQHPESKQVPK